MNKLTVLSFGDSVVWGQGLLDEQKMHILAGRSITSVLGIPRSRLDFYHFAHSGAVINNEDKDPVLDSELPNWQEIPNGNPSILQQVEAASSRLKKDRKSPDLIVLNGGINDLGFQELFLPGVDYDTLDEQIKLTCYESMRELLRLARNRFSDATIIVTGYYPILSEESSVDVIRAVVGLLSVPAPLIGKALCKKILKNMRFFHLRQLAWIRKAVSELHNSTRYRGPGIYFAHPAYGSQHAIGASDEMLFSPEQPEKIVDKWKSFIEDPLSYVLDLEPQDPMLEARKNACDKVRKHFEKLQCRIAAIGHPNLKGATRYARVITRTYLEQSNYSLYNEVNAFQRGTSELRIRRISKKHNLVPDLFSVRQFLQHRVIHVVEVTIKTKDQKRAGTNRDVILRLGSGWEWKLDKELHDDFERGSVETYTIDPSNGNLDRQLMLHEITELSLILVDPWLRLASWKPESIVLRLNGIIVYEGIFEKALDKAWPQWSAPDYPG